VGIIVRPRWPGLALLLLAPSIPELLTGSTPITTLFVNPIFFALAFLGIVGLYGGGALLIREFVVYFHKGWASVLLLGAAYGIGEEGFAVHTFFQPSGPPVNALGSYGAAFGVDWLWALGLTVFHATYSIALPILLTGLFFPAARDVRWLDRGGLLLTAIAYLVVVGLFSVTIGHGPTPLAFALFLSVALVLIFLAGWVPRDLLRVRPGARRKHPYALAAAASLPFDFWTVNLILSNRPVVPALVTGILTLFVGLLAALLILRLADPREPEWTKFYLAVGMLGVLFVWDVVIEFAVPGILVVSLVFLYLLYRLHKELNLRGPSLPRTTGRAELTPSL
jgi:hypothetical protein